METTTKPDGTKVQTETKKDGTKVDTTPAAGQNWYDKGIRVSELRYITVEAALAGRATITLNCDLPVTRQKVTRRYK